MFIKKMQIVNNFNHKFQEFTVETCLFNLASDPELQRILSIANLIDTLFQHSLGLETLFMSTTNCLSFYYKVRPGANKSS